MNKIYAFATLAFGLLTGIGAQAQCPEGEVEVEIIVHTDAYGYEAYWELVPGGNDCGDATIANGGNDAVGCNGGGDQNQTPGGYGNGQNITEGPWCLTEGASFDLIYVDDWADGGFNFDVLVNGYNIGTYAGTGAGGTFSFVAAQPAEYDMSAIGSNMAPYFSTGMITVEANIQNLGTETVTDFSFNFRVNGGAWVMTPITGVSLENNEVGTFYSDTEWDANYSDDFVVEVWASQINGNPDENQDNDIYEFDLSVGAGIPNIIDQYIGMAVNIVTIANSSDDVNSPTDLDFHPTISNRELWVVNKDTENSGGSTVTIFDAGTPDQTEVWKRDGNAWHFMSLPTGIAFSENGNFANSPGVFDANHSDQDGAFTGPALWSSDMDIYAEPSGGNGSHLDMLHASPYCQGIAAETGNAFWIFDGYSNDICRYDFVEDHGPGNDYHGDGRILRYSDDNVARDPNHEIVSHLVLDAQKQWLYVVDHGNQRVIRVDITTGSLGGTPPYGPFENIAEYKYVTGYTQENVVTTGLSKPAGIDIIEDRMIVSEHESGEIIIYDISSMPAVELERIETGFSSLQGIKIGPDGKIWGVDYDSDTVFLIDGLTLSTDNVAKKQEPRVFPNPSANVFYIDNVDGPADYRLFDLSGKLIAEQKGQGQRVSFDLAAYPSGIYTLQILGDNFGFTKKLVKL